VAATEQVVVVGDRDPADTQDVFRCLSAADGSELWTLRYPARGQLDYGNSSRATPLIDGQQVFLYGALGQLHCVDLATGRIIWQKNIRESFGVTALAAWGFCSSPLIADGKLIINPGGKEAAIVALEPATGKILWQTPGEQAAFGSFIVGQFGGRQQLVGYDKKSLGGWDLQDGKRLWRLVPPRRNDFNVPTPISAGGHLLVSTENNGTREYQFKDDGQIDPLAVGEFADLVPDAHSPIIVGGKLFGVSGELFCLDAGERLKPLWTASDEAFSDYTSLVGSPTRVLITTLHGELLLIDSQSPNYRLVSRSKAFDDDSGVYSHPALVGTRLYLRGSTSIVCLDLSE
jgi:outer membrane protein assembly factor BamB